VSHTRTLRAAVARQGCTREELVMQQTVVGRTALWSRLEDRATVAELSSEAGRFGRWPCAG
jgi:hypothetical protein